MRTSSTLLRMAPWFLAVLPPAALCAFVYRFGIFVPYWDHWDIVPMLAKWQDQTLTLRDLLQPHNAHRLFFPYAIMLALASVTGWDVSYELLVNLSLGGCIAVLWGVLFQRAAATDRLGLRIALPFAVSLAVFSMIQWRNWLWGWQLQIFLVVAAVLLAVVLLFQPHGRGRALAGACAAAFVASYSFGAGVVIWPAALIGILLERDRPGRLQRAAVWSVAGIVTILMFYFLAGRPRRAPGFPSPDYTEPSYAMFFAGASGAGIAGYHTLLAACAGMAGMALFATLAWPLLRDRNWNPPAVPFVVMGLFGIGAAFLTMLGRGHDGLYGSVESRYTTLTITFWIALIALLAIGQRRAPAPWRPILLLVIVVAMGVNSYHGARVGSLRDPMQADARQAIIEGDTARILPANYPDEEVFLRRREQLKAIGLGPFR